MNQGAHDFLAILRLADLVQLVKVHHRVHAPGTDETIDYATPHASLVSVAVANKVRRVS